MCPDNLKRVCLYAQNLAKPPCVFVANLKIDAIYALYPESFCDKNLAIRKVFAFCDSAAMEDIEQLGKILKVMSVKQLSQNCEKL